MVCGRNIYAMSSFPLLQPIHSLVYASPTGEFTTASLQLQVLILARTKLPNCHFPGKTPKAANLGNEPKMTIWPSLLKETH